MPIDFSDIEALRHLRDDLDHQRQRIFSERERQRMSMIRPPEISIAYATATGNILNVDPMSSGRLDNAFNPNVSHSLREAIGRAKERYRKKHNSLDHSIEYLDEFIYYLQEENYEHA